MSIEMRSGDETFAALLAGVSFDAFVRYLMHLERGGVEVTLAANVANQGLVF